MPGPSNFLLGGTGGEAGYRRLLLPSLQTPRPGGLDSMAAVSTVREPAGKQAGQSGGDRG